MGNVLNLFYGGEEDNMVNYDNRPRPINLPSSGSSSNPQLESMVRSVKDVLPQVPISVIRSDLNITSNIEETITRLVDGTIQYTPEVPAKKSPSESSANTSTVAPVDASFLKNPPPSTLPHLSTKADSFGRSASERHKSFQERKQQLIEAARLRYMMKHNMFSTTAE